jgi:hypothetical protein
VFFLGKSCDAGFDFIEEPAGDAGGMGGGGMERDGNGLIDGPLELRGIGDHRLEDQVAQGVLNLAEIAPLEKALLLEL